ncbi:ABC transporter permease [Roseomonas sp. HF4]|uniref:ABC transporter permease n=1 Tax=Roseomonas sp. HF4 TaxID=2562313 RepID=UPI0014856ECC|nr:ABC transporter permease [Roseomonas sp. HF4]
MLSILGIGLAIGSAVALLGLGRTLIDGVEGSLEERGIAMIATQRGGTDIFGGRVRESLGPGLAAIPGVRDVEGELFAFTTSPQGRLLVVAGWSRHSRAWRDAPVAAGSLPGNDDRRAVLIGDVVAETLGLRIGDSLEVFDETFRIAGITRYTSALNRGLVVMPLDVLQEISFVPGQVTAFHLLLDPGLTPAQRADVRRAIEAAGPLRASEARELFTQDRDIQVLNAIAQAISMIALLVGGLNVLNTLLMSVQERTREIGIIAAMGWSDARIVALIMLEGAFLGLAGCVLGGAIGIGIARGFRHIPSIGDYLRFDPSLENLLLPIGFAMLICLAGSAYPAARAVLLSPAEALRRT